MKAYAVIDTNVLVSALYSKHPDAAPLQVVDQVFAQNLIPMYNDEILAEYNEVLRRPKFNFPQEEISAVIDAFIEAGIHSDRVETEESATDPKDIVFLRSGYVKGRFLSCDRQRQAFPESRACGHPA